MNKYELNELVVSLESALEELRDYRDELKYSDDPDERYYSKELSKGIRAVNINPLKRFVDSI